MADAPSPGSDLERLLREFDEAVVKPAVPHYRVSDFSRYAENGTENVATLHAVNGEPLERPEKLTFGSPPPEPAEPTFDERLEPILAPLRERVTAAEELLQRKTQEASAALSFRDDIERAAAAVRNVDTVPRRSERPSPTEALNMNDRDWAIYKERAARGEFR